MNPLTKAIDTCGAGQAGFARLINESLGLSGSDAITPQQVWNWLNRGDEIPAQYCPAIEKLCSGSVSRKDLRPEDWQKIWPELASATT
jgi:DNA-binding transcriptional regulator YdaS (Cro superfamily)